MAHHHDFTGFSMAMASAQWKIRHGVSHKYKQKHKTDTTMMDESTFQCLRYMSLLKLL